MISKPFLEEMAKVDSKQELQFLIDVLAQVISVVKVSGIEDETEREQKTDAHNLANRFIQFAMTILHLSDDRNVINLPSFGDIKFRDPASIDVLTRASMEAFLVFHQIFYCPATRNEKEFRYLVYKVVGLAEGQWLIESNKKYHDIKEIQRKPNELIISKLRENPVFKKLSPTQRDGITKGNNRDFWRWDVESNEILSWSKIASNAKLSPMLARYMYTYLSGHAHSGSRSVFQTQKAMVNGEIHKLVDSSLNTMKILCANMISEYTAIFKEAHDKLLQTGAIKIVGAWVQIGRQLGENSDVAS